MEASSGVKSACSSLDTPLSTPRVPRPSVHTTTTYSPRRDLFGEVLHVDLFNLVCVPFDLNQRRLSVNGSDLARHVHDSADTYAAAAISGLY